MNKKQYLDALEKELLRHKVSDSGEVLADYEAHFTRKALDGYTEEEIAKRLGAPAEIAVEFLPAAEGEGARKGLGAIRAALIAADLYVIPFFVLLFAWAAAMAACSLGVFALGGYLALGMTSISAIPVLPAAGGLLMGLSILALSVLLFMGFLWFLELAVQMTRAYRRWHGSRWNARHELPLPVMPLLTGKRRRVTRRIVLTSLVCFVVLFAAAFAVMSAQAGTPGFWHHWHWFETV